MSGDGSCIDDILEQALQFGFIGTMAGVVKKAWQAKPSDALPPQVSSLQNRAAVQASRSAASSVGMIGASAASMAVVGATFAGARCATQDMRGKDDHWNEAVGACLASTIISLRAKKISKIFTYCAGASAGASVLYYEYSDYKHFFGAAKLRKAMEDVPIPEHMRANLVNQKPDLTKYMSEEALAAEKKRKALAEEKARKYVESG